MTDPAPDETAPAETVPAETAPVEEAPSLEPGGGDLHLLDEEEREP